MLLFFIHKKTKTMDSTLREPLLCQYKEEACAAKLPFARYKPPLCRLLIFTCAAKTAAVCISKSLCLLKTDRRLMLLNAKLADTVIQMDRCITDGKHGHFPYIMISAIALVHDAHMIRLNDPKILISGAARHNDRLIPLGKLHGYAKTDQSKFSLF